MKKPVFLVIVSTFLLMLGQNLNIWNAAPKIRFDKGLLANGDGFFIGKIAVSEQEGLFKNIGAVAQVLPGKELTDEEELAYRRSFLTSYSRDAYINKTKIKEIQYYNSKTAIHSFFYNLGNYLFKPDPATYLKFLVLQKTLLFSLILSLVILWTVEVTNIFTGILLLLSFMFSPIMTLIARTLYFAPFTFYVPFLTACYFLHLDYKQISIFKTKHYFYIGLAFLFHMCFHTFEYISTMGIASITPFIFYGLLKQDSTELFQRTFRAGCSYFAAITIGVLLLLVQYKTLNQTAISEGSDHILHKVQQRAIGIKIDQIAIDTAETGRKRQVLMVKQKAQQASYGEVIKIFFNDTAIGQFEKNQLKYRTRYSGFMYLFGISGLILSMMLFFKKNKDSSKIISLLLSCLFSFLAPLSWWVIFKPHSYHHAHFVVFAWMLPFTIFGFMIVGYAIEQIIHNIKKITN